MKNRDSSLLGECFFQKNQKVFKNIFEKIKRFFEKITKKTEKYEKVSKKIRRKTVGKRHNDMHAIHC